MRIAVVDIGLHPDRETVEAAVARLGETHEVHRFEVGSGGGDDALWDAVLDAVLEADRVFTL